MKDHAERKEYPFILWNQIPQLHLYLSGSSDFTRPSLLLTRKTWVSSNRRYIKCCTEDNTRCLSANTGQARQLLHCGGNLAAKIRDELFCSIYYHLCLVLIKTCWPDFLLKGLYVCIGIVLCCAVFLKSFSVTSFTLTSVHCAERIVATRSSRGFENLRAILGWGIF